MSVAAPLSQRVREALGDRQLIWLGSRGVDAAPLEALGVQLRVISTIGARETTDAADSEICLELISGSRPDLDDPGLDLEALGGYANWSRRAHEAAGMPSLLVPWGPGDLAAGLALRGSVREARPPADLVARLDAKSFVDTAVGDLGIEGLGWRTVAHAEAAAAADLFAAGPVVARAEPAQGGEAVAPARDPEELRDLLALWGERRISVSRLRADAIPLNAPACLFADGSLRLHPPSVQLIGIEECTNRPFGYSGADYGLASRLGPAVLGRLERMVRAIAPWLHSLGYVGAFGVDALLDGDELLFVELNPRFQGSSATAASLVQALGVSDIYVDHLAAHLGLEPGPDAPTLANWGREQPARALLVPHNRRDEPVSRSAASHPAADLEMLAPPGVEVAPEGPLARLTLEGPVSANGLSLTSRAAIDALAAVADAFEPAQVPAGT